MIGLALLLISRLYSCYRKSVSSSVTLCRSFETMLTLGSFLIKANIVLVGKMLNFKHAKNIGEKVIPNLAY